MFDSGLERRGLRVQGFVNRIKQERNSCTCTRYSQEAQALGFFS